MSRDIGKIEHQYDNIENPVVLKDTSTRAPIFRGDIQLVPTPSDDPEDPLNWSSFKKHYTLAWVCYLAFLQGFSVTIIIPGYKSIAQDLHTTPYHASFLVAAVTICHSVIPIIFCPFSVFIGRRWLLLIFTTISFGATIGCAEAQTYGTMMVARIFQGSGASLGWGLPPAIVADMFFYHERGHKMGMFVLFSLLGIIIGPLVSGFIVQYKGWRFGIWLTAILTGFPCVGMLFTYPETLYVSRYSSAPREYKKRSYWDKMRPHYMPKEVRGEDSIIGHIIRPFKMLKYPSVSLAGLYFGWSFMWKVGIGTTLPEFFPQLYNFTPASTGLVYLGFLVGAVLGEQMAGPFSDWIIRRLARRNGGRVEPEMRLRAIFLGSFLCPLGLFIFGLVLHYKAHWIGAVIALGIYTFGLEIIGTITTCYSVDCYRPQSPEIGAIYSVFRNMVSENI